MLKIFRKKLGMSEWSPKTTHRFGAVAFIFAMLFCLGFSLAFLTTKPRMGVDESMTIDIAHNLLLFGKMNAATSAGEFIARPYTVVATGYPVTVPLALWFKMFGFGLAQARLYMLVWILLFFISSFLILRKLFGIVAAGAGTLLVATFPTFYDIGRTAMGELPGFLLLLWGAYFLGKAREFSVPKYYVFSGLLLGLAVATKPSLYISLIPLTILYAIVIRKELSLRNFLTLGVAMAVPVLMWIVLVFPQPLHIETWQEASSFLSNPFGRPISGNILENLNIIFTETTFLYFYGISAIILLGFFTTRNRLSLSQRSFQGFLLGHAAFGFLYFMRSPGWIRYIYSAELVLLLLLFPGILLVLNWLRKFRRVPESEIHLWAKVVLVWFVGVQIVQLFFFSRILSSDVYQTMANAILPQLQDKDIVGVIDIEQVASLIPVEHRYHYFLWTGTPPQGRNPLSLTSSQLPRFIVFEEKRRESLLYPYRDVFEQNYILQQVFNGSFYLYERKS